MKIVSDDSFPIRILAIGDIHFGIKHSEKLYEELNEVFINYLEDNKEDIDMVFFVGDYFDKKLSLNEAASKLALRFMDKVISICSKSNIKVRMVKGTLSHDFTQLENFKHYELKHDFKIINTASIEEIEFVGKTKKKEDLIGNLSIFYVPEEYMENQKEFYQEFINDVDEETKYDLMIGHGTWDFVAFLNQKIESERSLRNAPVYDFKDWSNYTYGPCIFGHIHTRQSKGKKVYYTGSFSRWQHGETKAKGFLDIDYDLVTTDSIIHFVENVQAPIFNEISIDDIDEQDENNKPTIESTIETIEQMLLENDNLKIDLTDSLAIEEIAVIKEYFNTNENISFILDKKKFKEDEERDTQFDFITEDNLTKPAIIQKYLNIQNGKKLSQVEITKIITKEDSEEE